MNEGGEFIWYIPVTLSGEDWGTVEFTYSTMEPLEMTLDFPMYRDPVKVARDVVCLGMVSPEGKGEGDVRVRQHPEGVEFTVSGIDCNDTDNEVTYRWVLDRMHLGVAVAITGEMVPFGHETLDLDEELADLLGGEM